MTANPIELIKLMNRVLDLLHGDSDEIDPEDRSLVVGAYRAQDAQLLRFYVEYLSQEKYSSLMMVSKLHGALVDNGVDNPAEELSIPRMRMFLKLYYSARYSVRTQHRDVPETILAAACLSGESDVEFLESVISERCPENVDEFTAALELVRSAPVSSLSSGVL